jgi:cofilin
LPPTEYRFGVYDIEFKTNDGINSSKIFFTAWLPEGTKIKIKMLYATGKESFKSYLDLNTK